MKVPLQFHLKRLFSEEPERDRCILFHLLNVKLFLDDLTCFTMMHSFQHFFILKTTAWDTSVVSKPSRGRAVPVPVKGRRAVRGHPCDVGRANPAIEGTLSCFLPHVLTWHNKCCRPNLLSMATTIALCPPLAHPSFLHPSSSGLRK